jgi:acetyl-CoA carboxylase carboxyl transferase subunit beta
VNWLERFVRPKIRAFVRKSDIPENLWEKCPACEQMVFHRDLEANRFVCTACGHHMHFPPLSRLAEFYDEGAFERLELPEAAADPLRFRDRTRYSERLTKARQKTGETDALIAASGRIGGRPAVLAVLDFAFMGGSMGQAVGEGFLTAARRAVADKAAFIAVTSSGGARMQEGTLSLMQMARTTIAVEEVKEAGLPYIVVLTNPTTGGVTASFAMLGDVAIAEPNAIIGFAGTRVIQETIRETLPEGFQRAEYLLEHGMVDMVVNRRDLRATLVRVLGLLAGQSGPATGPVVGAGADGAP